MEGTPNEVDLVFITLVRAKQFAKAAAMIDAVKDINVRHPETGATALHFAAVSNARRFLAILEKRQDLNYCVRDAQDRSPSEIAWVGAANEVLGAELLQREIDYARRHGLVWKPHP